MKAFVFLSLLLASPAIAAVTISEAVFGPFSNFPEAPSDLGSLGLGNNMIIGTINEGATTVQPDSVRFTVSEGQVISSLSFMLSSGGESHFLSLLDGSIDIFEPGAYLFATLVTSTQNGINLLPLETDGGSFASETGATGYELPLPAGSYSLWFQETQGQGEGMTLPVDYSFQITTQAVPEPNSSVLLACASIFLLCQRRRGL